MLNLQHCHQFRNSAVFLPAGIWDRVGARAIFDALRTLAPCDDRPEPSEALRRLVEACLAEQPVALSQVPPRGLNDGPRLRVRSWPIDEVGLVLEVVPRWGRSVGWDRRLHFEVLRCEVDGPRVLHGIERLVHGLVGDEGSAGLDEHDLDFLQQLPSPAFDAPQRWREWRDLLDCLKDIEALKSLQLDATVVDESRSADDEEHVDASARGREVLVLELSASLSRAQGEVLRATPLQLVVRGCEHEIELDGEVAANSGVGGHVERPRLRVRGRRGKRLPRVVAGEDVQLVGAPDATCLDRQGAALEALLEGRAANPRFVQSLINPREAGELDEGTWPRIEVEPALARDLNAAQRRAVEIALSRREISLVWGPPGTGKTQAIAAMCQSAARAGLRVLVASQSNVAVDNVIERVMDLRGVRAWRMPQKDMGKLQRAVLPVVGPAAVTKLLERVEPFEDDLAHGPAGELAAIVERFKADSRSSARMHAPANEDLLDAAYRRSANVVGATCSQAAKLAKEHAIPRFDLVIIDEVSKATMVEMLPALVLARKAVFVGDHHQLPPIFKDDEQSLEETIDQSKGRLDKDRIGRAKALVEESWFQQAVDQGRDRPDLLVMLDTQYRAAPRISAAYARFYKQVQGGLKDGVEASARALPLPLELAGLRLGVEQGIAWFDTGRICREEPSGTSRRNQGEARFVMQALLALGKQARSIRPELWSRGRIAGALVGQRAIVLREGLDKSQQRQHGPGPRGLHPTLWIEGREVSDDHLLVEGERYEHGPALEVAVATFYKAQKDLLQSLARRERGLVGLRVKIDSVDSFQGAEADIVLLSMVRTGFKPDSPFVTEFRRVNVAMSRAKRLLCLVGALEDFRKARVRLPGVAQPVHVYEEIQRHIQSCGGIHRL